MAIGLYLHIPFCASKCPYCDFYSLVGSSEETKDAYVQALIAAMERWAAEVAESADTVYLGGGTPSLLGGARIAALVETARRVFAVPDGAEITMEANPGDGLEEVFSAFAAVGGNRVSLGMQTQDDRQLKLLGRRHTARRTEEGVEAARRAGIRNLSLDLMLGISGQTSASVEAAVAHCEALGASHVSAYLLKVEPETSYAVAPPPLPGEEETVMLYHTAAAALERAGYAQYEISNFARDGQVSRHNLKYWNLEPYLGLGPAAHSFLNGRRFYYPRSLTAFLKGEPPIAEEEGTTIGENSQEEYAMLRLRLTEGLTEVGFARRFGQAIPARWRERAAAFPPSLVVADDRGLRLTREGFLVSDALLVRILL